MRVEALAASLGVSKGGFYWHFTDRQALLEEMLDTWEKAGTEDVIARVESEPADPRAKLQQLFELARSADFAVELALRDWSRRDGDVAERLRRVDNRRMGYLRSLFGAVLRRRGRRRGPQHAGLLAVHRQLLHRRPSTVTRPGPRCCSSRSTDCSASRGTDAGSTSRPVLVYDGDCAFCTTLRALPGEDRAGCRDRRLAAHRSGRAGDHRGAGGRRRAVGRGRRHGPLGTRGDRRGAEHRRADLEDRRPRARCCRGSRGWRRGPTGWSRTTATGCPGALRPAHASPKDLCFGDR